MHYIVSITYNNTNLSSYMLLCYIECIGQGSQYCTQQKPVKILVVFAATWSQTSNYKLKYSETCLHTQLQYIIHKHMNIRHMHTHIHAYMCSAKYINIIYITLTYLIHMQLHKCIHKQLASQLHSVKCRREKRILFYQDTQHTVSYSHSYCATSVVHYNDFTGQVARYVATIASFHENLFYDLCSLFLLATQLVNAEIMPKLKS